MRIGILVPSIGAFGQKGFYNAQEIGLAKALANACEEVKVYRLVDISVEERKEMLEGYSNVQVHFIPAKRIGNNGLVDVSVLDQTLDALVFFSDMQIAVPKVHRWAQRYGIPLIPYIGVMESHSTNRIKKTIMELLFQRNLAVYRKHHCIVKTPKVQQELTGLGVRKVTVAPVGLDLSLMHMEYQNADPGILKQKFGFSKEDKILLFIGRLCQEKQPVRMIEIFSRLQEKNEKYRLLMVGTGELKDDIMAAIDAHALADKVRMIDRIPNKDIWELYRIADCFVNLNQQEIFGMAILEAMYYGCKVAAWEAPGPSFIIEDGISGCLADSDEGIVAAICLQGIQPQAANNRILSCFTWENAAKRILDIVKQTA